MNTVLPIKAVPNAARSEVVGWLGDSLKVKIKAPPVDGKANAERCRFLAATLGLPKGAVPLATGTTARQKRVRIAGLDAPTLRIRLAKL
ncbi:MAG: DUF167 domain-containing protein [Candidatus Synoicihabitans palmerolidicus]|nr:DUF167 domain-containing protein [Candidatus Synoicihabitans palmerolidicus]MCC5022135.1 DUF167 domain-containing protein [Candidatus Synoicihabitans palmerolidicus]